jgi:hypothetical protein
VTCRGDLGADAIVHNFVPAHVHVNGKHGYDLDDLIRPIGPSTRIRGWVYDFVPLAGISYVF